MTKEVAAAKRRFWEKEHGQRLASDRRRTPSVVEAEFLYRFWEHIELLASGAKIGEDGIDLGAFGFSKDDDIDSQKQQATVSSDDCLMTTSYFDRQEADEDDECEVVIRDSRIVVSYWDDEGVVNYIGTEVAPGHFLLAAPERKGEAILHRVPGGRFMDGFWIQDGAKGFWRIRLPA